MKKLVLILLLISNNLSASSSLIKAAQIGDLLEVQKLLQTKVKVDYLDENDKTALIWAASRGHLPVVQFLLKAGADPNHQDDQGNTALFCALNRAHTEVALFLWNHTDSQLQNKNKQNALSIALSNHEKFTVKFTDLIRVLLRNNSYIPEQIIQLNQILINDPEVQNLKVFIASDLNNSLIVYIPKEVADIVRQFLDFENDETDERLLHFLTLVKEVAEEEIKKPASEPKQGIIGKLKRSIKKPTKRF